MIRRHHLVEVIQEKVNTYLGNERARHLFMRDVAWKPLDLPEDDRRLGLWLFFDGEQCIYIGFSEDDFYRDEMSHVSAVLLGTKSFTDITGRRWRTPKNPPWETYLTELERPKSPARRADRNLFLSRFSALFFPMDFAVDRLFWGATLIRVLRPRCNHAVHGDKIIRKKLAALVPAGCSDDQQVAALEQEGLVIDLIDAPSEKVQIGAVRSYSYAIAEIMAKGITPSRDVILTAAASHGHVIELLDQMELDEEILLAAVRSTPGVVSQIEAPSAKIQEEAVTLLAETIAYISDPTEKAQVIAVSHDPDLLFVISDPCDEAKLAYLRQRPSEFAELTPLSDEVKISLIAENPSLHLLLVSDGFTDHPLGSDILRQPVVRELLLRIKGRGSRSYILTIIEKLKRIGYDWSELDAMERSLRVDIK